MRTYQEFITDITTNDAAIEAVAVVLTLNRWGEAAVASTIGAGESTRAWWESGASTETGHHGSWVIRQVTVIVYIAIALCVQAAWGYFVSGKAEAHWQLINDVVDDGLGLYGPSPMLQRWVNAATAPIVVAGDPELEELLTPNSLAEEQIAWALQKWPELAA